MQSNTWVVIPTYNERENLEPLLAELQRHFSGSILIVDDHSPDGTGQLADGLRSKYPNLEVMHRPIKTGLGDAYRAGLQFALDRGAERIVHGDADQSHPPRLIPTLLSRLDTADLVVASRYVPGGTIAIPAYRRMISLVGNWYIRGLLGRAVHDWSSGFCAWKREALQAALRRTTRTVGYAWLIEMKWRARQGGATIAEIPLVFVDRQAGQSKFSWAIMREDVSTAWRLRFGG